MRLALTAAALLAAAAFPAAAADTISGEVLAHDRVAHRIVLEDRSVVSYDPAKIQLPDDLKAGDTVSVSFTGSEGEIANVLSITRSE